MYTGKLVKLREYKREDVPMALAYLNDPEVKRYLAPGIPYPMTLENEYKWFESQNGNSKDGYNFAIESIEDKKYIGGCGINEVDWKNNIAIVGIFLCPEYHGRGYGTDAMRALVRFIFNQMNIRKVELKVYSFNKRAIKSYEKTGFKIEGTLRKEIFRDGEYHDEICMGLFRDEFIDK